MLTIKNLSASIKDSYILKNINLTINPGEIHALMGPKQSGKSSLIHTIIGNKILTVKKGTIAFITMVLLPNLKSISFFEFEIMSAW